MVAPLAYIVAGLLSAGAAFGQQVSTARILLYTATADFRHDSIPTAIEALQNQSSSFDVQFDSTEDKSKFTDENLALYDALMFVSTTGEGQSALVRFQVDVQDVIASATLSVLDSSGKTAFQNYLDKGGNFIGASTFGGGDVLKLTTRYLQGFTARLIRCGILHFMAKNWACLQF